MQIALVFGCVLVLSLRSVWLPVLMAVVAVVLIWLSGDSWRALGFGRPAAGPIRWITEGIITGLLCGFISVGILSPALSGLFHVAPVTPANEGDLAYYASSFVLSWVVNALCKGVTYRAFLLNRLEAVFGQTPLGTGLGLVVASVLFGLGNWLQGPVGVGVALAVGAVFNLQYYWWRRNLWPSLVAHGVYNTSIFTLVFMGRL